MPMDWEEWQKSRQKQRPAPPRNDGGDDGNKGGPQIPNIGELWSKLKNFGGGRTPIWIFPLIIVALWLISGFFTVEPYEQGLVQRFGKYSRPVDQGLRYHLPWPIESVIKVNVTQTRQADIGRRDSNAEEITMLTKDENIVNLLFVIQYRVTNPEFYAFRVDNPEKSIKDAAVSAMREVIGRNTIDGALTDKRADIQADTKTTLQAMLTKYNTGVTIDNVVLQDVHVPPLVIDAFKDVTSAKEDSNRSVNEAEGYKNNKLPEAEAKAFTLVYQAQAYEAERVNQAQGDASRFSALLAEYRKAPDVTRQRLVLETMDKVLPGLDKYVLTGQTSQSVLPLLGLNPSLISANSQEAAPAGR